MRLRWESTPSPSQFLPLRLLLFLPLRLLLFLPLLLFLRLLVLAVACSLFSPLTTSSRPKAAHFAAAVERSLYFVFALAVAFAVAIAFAVAVAVVSFTSSF